MNSQDFNFHRIPVTDSVIYLLSFSEFDVFDYLDELTAIETERFFSFNNLKRKREFVATRILRGMIFGKEHIHYNNNGAPYISGVGNISISHTDGVVGIAVNTSYAIGFDIEKLRPSIVNIQHKFVSTFESNLIVDPVFDLTKIWSAKETLYKLANRKEIDFIRDLFLVAETTDSLRGEIHNFTHKLFTQLQIITWKNYILTINSAPCERFV